MKNKIEKKRFGKIIAAVAVITVFMGIMPIQALAAMPLPNNLDIEITTNAATREIEIAAGSTSSAFASAYDAYGAELYYCFTQTPWSVPVHGATFDGAGWVECSNGAAIAWDNTETKYLYVLLVTFGDECESYTLEMIAPAPDNGGGSGPSASHTHHYEWKTITEASLGQDGREQYACSCGDVQLTQSIPAAQVYIKGLYDAVKNAPKDGTVDINSGKWTGISDYVIKKLAERTDVNTKITFEYKNSSYTFTIPSGTSYESLLNDKENYYGFFTFCNLLGIPVTQL